MLPQVIKQIGYLTKIRENIKFYSWIPILNGDILHHAMGSPALHPIKS